MEDSRMIVTAWNNGDHHETGAGYGIKIDVADRNRHFKRTWKTVQIEIDGASNLARVNVAKKSFWNKECRELISAEIGRWLYRRGLAPWAKDDPPKLLLEVVSERRFRLLQQ